MIKTQLSHRVQSTEERLWFHTVLIQLIEREVEILETRLHVSKHISWNALDPIPNQHQVNQGLRQERWHQVQVVVREIY